jgi:hypothetical protein
VDLYADPPLSLYVDDQGSRRPIARIRGEPALWYDDFTRMDDVLGRGGQLRSFEAVFSPVGDDGLPRKLYDRATGRVDPEVAHAWETYDIRLVLERNWPERSAKLAGKLHIATGSIDTFYLEGAVRLLGQKLQELGSDAEVEIVEGADHGSILTAERFAKMRRQMSESYLRHHAKQPTGAQKLCWHPPRWRPGAMHRAAIVRSSNVCRSPQHLPLLATRPGDP